MNNDAWNDFVRGNWCDDIDVSDFILSNYREYLGNDSFLVGPSSKTSKLWSECLKLLDKEKEKGVLDIDTIHVSGVNSFLPGYIDKSNEVIFGLQTDKPLCRMVNPYGGIRMVYSSMESYNYKLDKDVDKYFNMFRKTHNQGVFDCYTKEMKLARHCGLLTGLPDAYGRGRIIGDYRRIALYGIDYLKEKKKSDLENLNGLMLDDLIRLREEVSEQIRALDEIKSMANSYGIDISCGAKNALDAVQFVYFGYLASVKENNGAAMSLGRVSTFLDIYIQRDLDKGLITESDAQELIDQLVIKLRLVRHLRTPEYDELFSGDPTWVTESIGGMCDKGSLVTKTSYRFLHTLTNLDSAPEPNMTILWSKDLPVNFKKYCSKMSILTDSLQYESDDLMRPIYGCDYGIACCVSAMRMGSDMQFFGARCNLAKMLLYSMNGGIDEVTFDKVIDGFDKITDKLLNYDRVLENYLKMMDRVALLYTSTMNIIHYMHDKYAYEKSQMALLSTVVNRYMAFGVAGLSVVVDSLSAIKYAKVYPVYNQDGIIVDFDIEGDFPKYGNDIDKVDDIAKLVLESFYKALSKYPIYRGSKHTLSVLTITSNVVYGKKTGATPDGREAGVSFAPGANPMHNRDLSGACASLNSVAKLDYSKYARDGISNTFSIIPEALGDSLDKKVDTLLKLLDGYFIQGAHHLNVNVLNRETLIDAMEHPDLYPLLTIRVSGYAVRFNKLTKEQQKEVISRTFHER